MLFSGTLKLPCRILSISDAVTTRKIQGSFGNLHLFNGPDEIPDKKSRCGKAEYKETVGNFPT